MKGVLSIFVTILSTCVFIVVSKPFDVKDASSNIQSNQQTTGSVTGFANSTATGNGEEGSAVAYAWQGGQTSASGSQSSTADNNGAHAAATGTATCQQGYIGTAGSPNSTQANSNGNATCVTAYTDEGTQNTSTQKDTKGKGKIPPGLPSASAITLNSTSGQLGEGVSGQSHGSVSNVGGPSGGTLSIYAGGFANTPQSGMSIQQSSIDALGLPSLAQLDVLTEQNTDADEQTWVSLGGGQFAHSSGGLSAVQGLGTSFSNGWNSHDETDDEDEQES